MRSRASSGIRKNSSIEQINNSNPKIMLPSKQSDARISTNKIKVRQSTYSKSGRPQTAKMNREGGLNQSRKFSRSRQLMQDNSGINLKIKSGTTGDKKR